jgi:hypothetical protein
MHTMKIVVADSSSLVLLAKCGLLEIVCTFLMEVKNGKADNYKDT